MLSLPLTAYALVALRMRDAALFLCFLAYGLVLTPALSMVYFPNSLLDAFMASSRTWPVTGYFALGAALVLLRPSEATLWRAFTVIGWSTFATMWLLWFTVPTSVYTVTAGVSNMFSWDAGRGYFIRMPMMIGEWLVFCLARQVMIERRIRLLPLIVALLASMIYIYKARLPIGVTVLIILLGMLEAWPLRRRFAMLALAAPVLAAAAFVFLPKVPDLLARLFDESLFVRLRSVGVAWTYMTEHVVRLLFGVGAVSSASEISMGEVLGYADFWITDIGWLGVVLEFGVIGTALIVAFHLRALGAARAVAGKNPQRLALADCALFEILCSAVYSPMYAPGPIVSIAAIAWWLAERDRRVRPPRAMRFDDAALR